MTVIGSRGPIPNRESDLARPRERKGSDVQSVTKGTLKPVTIPEADENWHPIAKRMWDSLATSGQADFYQDSDWATAYMLMDNLSIYSQPRVDRDGIEYHKRSPEMFKAILSGLASLMVTEGDRRRLRLELSAPDDGEGDAALYAIEDYKQELGVD